MLAEVALEGQQQRGLAFVHHDPSITVTTADGSCLTSLKATQCQATAICSCHRD
jgi:hypothetical protein